MFLGAHESVAGGLHLACDRALEDGAEAVQIFVKSANRWFGRALDQVEIDTFRAQFQKIPADRWCAHGAYLLNLAAAKDDTRKKAIASLVHELDRCAVLGIPYLVLHPGSHVGQGTETGLERIAAALDEVHDRASSDASRVLLEIMAGQGTNLGASIEELRRIIDLAASGDRLDICLDTCHLFAAGYAIHTEKGYRAFRGELDRWELTDRVRVVHLNDSAFGLGSRKDRHANIDRGEIGLDGFRWILNDPTFADRLGILETPHGEEGRRYREELSQLRSLFL